MENDLTQELMECFAAVGPKPLGRLNDKYGKGEKAIMFALEKNGGTGTPGELAEFLQVGSGRIGNALKSLEAKGYITRKPSPEDRRVTLVTLTEKGREFGREKHRAFRHFMEELVSAIGEEDAGELMRILKKIDDAGLSFAPKEEADV